MKTIILATDFSPAAHNAACYAAEMAQAIQAALHLLHVWTPPVNYSQEGLGFNPLEWHAQAEEELKDLKKELHQQVHDSLVITTEVRMGTFMQELPGICKKRSPYAVVIGATGKSAAERLLFGSNAIRVMKHLEWPVIAVPQGLHFTAIRNIGLACDLKDITGTVPVYEVEHWINEFKATLHILNISPINKYDPNVIHASDYLSRLMPKVKPQFHFLADAQTDQGILDFAEANDIDLLIILPKRHTLVDAIFHKSHTKMFVLHSHVPVMALHNTEDALKA